ncbi:Zinc finger MYND domain-containing protein 12, partial [Coelomomyces lativittatus]
QFSHAIPAALQALRCTVIISGTQSPELVPCYLLLGEASIGLKDYEQAESYLASAEWALQKTPNTQIQAKLFHHFGLLYFSKEKYTAALNALTQSLYLASPWMHPLDIRMSGTFFQLGRVFQAQKEPLKATSAFLQVTESWLRYFQETSSVRDVLDAAQTAEAHVMFHQMTDFFHESPALLMKVKAVYALFLKSLGHTEEAMVTFQVALKLAMAPHSHGFYDWKGVFPWIARVFDGQSQNLTSFPPQLDDTTTHFPSDEALIPSKNMIPPNLEGNNVFAK